jgi:hypothetical protein
MSQKTVETRQNGGHNLPHPLIEIGLTYLPKTMETCLQRPSYIATALCSGHHS